jgi:F-box and leucine-rich repeat protein 2/20
MVTDDGVRHIGTGAGAAEFLTVLELDNCPLISDAALEHLSGCQTLQRIELYDCQLITRAGIRRLKVSQGVGIQLFLSLHQSYCVK